MRRVARMIIGATACIAFASGANAQLPPTSGFRSAPPLASVELAQQETSVDPAALARIALLPPLRYGVWSRAESGGWRRNVEAARGSTQGAGAFGGLKIGTRSALMGGVELERTTHAPSTVALLNSFTIAPFAVLDTFAPQLTGMALRLEGTMARTIGPWDAGLTARYAGVEAVSEHSSRMRMEQASALEFVAGIGHRVGGSTRVAATLRWRDANETVRLMPNPFGGVAYYFVGFEDPLPLSYDQNIIFRRSANGALDASLIASSGSVRRGVGLVVQRLQQHDNQHTQRVANAPLDRWTSEGWGGAMTAHLTLRDTSRRISARLSARTADDETRRHDLSAIVHRASRSEATMGVRAETPLPWMAGTRWTFGLDTRMEDATHDDYLVRTHWSRKASGWLGSARADWQSRGGHSLAALGAFGMLTPTSVLPAPTALSPAFRRWLYDGFAMEGTPTSTTRGAVDAGWKLRNGDVIHLLVDGTVTTPRNATLPLVPTGKRSVVTVSVRWEPR
ncbi:MAG: DUF6850 family outer membrane beta-barrel protein [Gemmatimonadaceae bacterium]